MVDGAGSTGSGIGGTSAVVDVGGVPVFVKRVPLTDTERRPGSVMSTANLFGLPVFCQYGVGGPGFGAWRELAANAVTPGWVLASRTEAFLTRRRTSRAPWPPSLTLPTPLRRRTPF
jgi:hypothetical protein